MTDNTYDKGRLNLPFVGICTFGKYPYVEDWDNIKQVWFERILTLKDVFGNKLNIRPHWAKEWESLKYGEISIMDYYRTIAYRDNIKLFLSDLETISNMENITLSDLKSRFSNK